jgi:hypothetical protein
VRKQFLSNIHLKHNLRAIILALHDAVMGIKGKVDYDFSKSPKYNKNQLKELREKLLELRKVSKTLAMELGKAYLLSKPRDKFIFDKFIEDAKRLIFEKLEK